MAWHRIGDKSLSEPMLTWSLYVALRGNKLNDYTWWKSSSLWINDRTLLSYFFRVRGDQSYRHGFREKKPTNNNGSQQKCSCSKVLKALHIWYYAKNIFGQFSCLLAVNLQHVEGLGCSDWGVSMSCVSARSPHAHACARTIFLGYLRKKDISVHVAPSLRPQPNRSLQIFQLGPR